MHTLGHPVSHSYGHGGNHNAIAAVLPVSMIDSADMVVATVTHVDMRGAAMPLNPLEVCLAVLAAGMILLLAAMLVARLRRVVSECHVRAACSAAGPGPPQRVSAGLLLADLSVMRN